MGKKKWVSRVLLSTFKIELKVLKVNPKVVSRVIPKVPCKVRNLDHKRNKIKTEIKPNNKKKERKKNNI